MEEVKNNAFENKSLGQSGARKSYVIDRREPARL